MLKQRWVQGVLIVLFLLGFHWGSAPSEQVLPVNLVVRNLHEPPIPWEWEPEPRIQADSAIVIDSRTGAILWSKDAHLRRDPASTTKILTAILAFERGNLRDRVLIDARSAAVTGSSMDLRVGEVLNLEELLWGLLMKSGNDAATAIARFLAGTEQEFANWMNQRAWELGAYNSHFVNPHGLTAGGHYTTAYDLAILARHALQIPLFREIVGTKEASLEDPKGRHLVNTNQLLWNMPDADGVKTGTTSAAGRCLVSSATREGWQLIAVVLHSPNRFGESAALLEWGFRHFSSEILYGRGDHVGFWPVERGESAAVSLVTTEPVVLLLPKTWSDVVEWVMEGERLTAPVEFGQPVAQLVARAQGVELVRVGLMAGADVPRKPFFHWPSIF